MPIEKTCLLFDDRVVIVKPRALWSLVLLRTSEGALGVEVYVTWPVLLMQPVSFMLNQEPSSLLILIQIICEQKNKHLPSLFRDCLLKRFSRRSMKILSLTMSTDRSSRPSCFESPTIWNTIWILWCLVFRILAWAFRRLALFFPIVARSLSLFKRQSPESVHLLNKVFLLI